MPSGLERAISRDYRELRLIREINPTIPDLSEVSDPVDEILKEATRSSVENNLHMRKRFSRYRRAKHRKHR